MTTTFISPLRAQLLKKRRVNALTSGPTKVKGQRIQKVNGKVWLRKAGQFNWEDAAANYDLSPGDTLKTLEGVATISNPDGTSTSIKGGSFFKAGK